MRDSDSRDGFFYLPLTLMVHQYVIPLLRKIGEYRISCVGCSLSPCAMILLNYGLTNRNHRNAYTLGDLSQNLVTNLLLQNSTPGHILGSDLSLWPAFTKIQSWSGFQGQIFHCDLLLWSDTVLDSISLFQLVWAPLRRQCIHPSDVNAFIPPTQMSSHKTESLWPTFWKSPAPSSIISTCIPSP